MTPASPPSPPTPAEPLAWDRIILGLRQTTKAFIENVLQNIIESIVVTDLDGRLVFFNQFSQELFGYPAEEVLGRHVSILGVREPDVLGLIRRNLPFSGELVFRRRDGRELPARVRCVPLRDEDDRPIAMVGVASDLTGEREKERIDAEFQSLKEQLFQAEKLALLGTLASETAHEINNPLGGLILAVQMLIRDFREDPAGIEVDAVLDELREIEADARRCKRITQQLLDFSRAIPEERALLDLNRVVEDALSLVQRQAELDDISFTKLYSPHLPSVRGNSNSLQQVVINLVKNARDAMPGGGALRVETRAPEPGSRWVTVVFTDTGPGIPEALADRVFAPFFTTKRPGEGTGLGLAVGRRIVEEHGGHLTLVRPEGGGAGFRIELPAARPEPEGASRD
ncbi:MAG: two-component system sensor histidine kinase NtrB [Deferrisomatales bacterium]